MNEGYVKVSWENNAKADLLGMIRLVLEQDDEEIYSEGVTIALPGRVKPE